MIKYSNKDAFNAILEVFVLNPLADITASQANLLELFKFDFVQFLSEIRRFLPLGSIIFLTPASGVLIII